MCHQGLHREGRFDSRGQNCISVIFHTKDKTAMLRSKLRTPQWAGKKHSSAALDWAVNSSTVQRNFFTHRVERWILWRVSFLHQALSQRHEAQHCWTWRLGAIVLTKFAYLHDQIKSWSRRASGRHNRLGVCVAGGCLSRTKNAWGSKQWRPAIPQKKSPHSMRWWRIHGKCLGLAPWMFNLHVPGS